MLKSRIYFLAPTLFLIFLLCYFLGSANAIEPYGTIATTQTTPYEDKLVFAHVLYRHGDRMIIDPYPNDPWGKSEFWPTGWGQLTNRGKLQHYKLGKWLRKRYKSLLSDKYNKDEVYIQSTDVDRTLMSAESNLAGLYEPVYDDVWDKEIKWQPIPVHTTPDKYDVLAGKAPCPAYDYAMSEVRSSPEFQQMAERFQYLFDFLTEKTGSKINTFEAIQFLNNTLYIEELYNKKLPDWTKEVYHGTDMTFITNFVFSIGTYTRKLARLKAGPLIKEMLERFTIKLKGKLKPNRNVWVYSAHDTTVANVLNTLNLFELHSPPYTACVMLELRLDANGLPYVSIFYKNSTAEPKAMDIPGCGAACPLSKMYTLYKDILPVDWERECKISTMMMTYEEANIGQAAAILVAIIIIMLFLSYVLMIYFRRRNYRAYSLPYWQVA